MVLLGCARSLAFAALAAPFLAGALVPEAVAGEAARPVARIGLLFDGPPPRGRAGAATELQELMDRARQEIVALTRAEFEVRFPGEHVVSGEWDLQRIRSAADRLLADEDVDLVIALGVLSTVEVTRRRDLPKPVIATGAIDVEAQGLPLENDATGIRNLNYMVSPASSIRDLESLREIVDVTKVYVLVDSLILEAVPGLADYAARAKEAVGLDLRLLPASTSASETLARLPPDAGAVYVTPLVRMTAEEFHRLVAGLIERRLPSFSLVGRAEVESGLLAGRRPPTDLPRRARRIALNVQRVLLGEDAGTLPVTLDEQEKLVVNMATARAIRLPIRWRVLTGAELLHEEEETGPSLTLQQAVNEAIRANLALRAKRREVAAGAQDVRRARSVLGPRVDASALGLRIDEDRASASLGSQAERSLAAGVSLSQILYSDAALANLAISRSLQGSLEQDLQTLRLDVALDAATAFLDVLRARTRERIQQNNLALTESNLELARRRERIGYSGPADVFRWESELARDRATVIEAGSRVEAARAVLNRVLHRPLEERFEPVPPDLEDPELLTGRGRLAPFLDTAQGVDLFREYLVRQGLARSPEIRALDAAIAAQERALVAARRSFWSPDLILSGELERELSRGGAGSGGVPPGLPFATPDRDDWSVGLRAALPLFTGGERAAEAGRAIEELSRLRLQRDGVAEAIELRVRTAMFAASSTFPAIDLARESAEAARKNLELVGDAYSQGVVSVIDLLDAQNAALVAEENAANAVFDFLLDLMELQRAADGFGFFMSEAQRQQWLRQVESFFAEAGWPTGSHAR